MAKVERPKQRASCLLLQISLQYPITHLHGIRRPESTSINLVPLITENVDFGPVRTKVLKTCLSVQLP